MRFQCPFCQFINTFSSGVSPGDRVNCASCRKPLKVPEGIEEGTVIGDYVIKAKIGSGSIGTVYRAVQLSLGRPVALKVLTKAYATRKGLEDFLSEARAAAKLNHPNLVQAFAVGESDGYCFMSMTLLSGMTVKTRIRQSRNIPVDEALHITQQIAEALHYAWTEAKIIHRDVKPENIILTDDGLVKLTDLGLAMRPKDWKEGMEISGSPSYMSPEQFYGEKLDSRSDIYSLGITLYQMLSGVLPFRSENVQELALQHTQEEAVPLSKLNLRIPPVVSALVKKMIAKYPDERFQSMEDLLGQIWKIRQKTAPDRDLVPSVHTISIRRLDYDRQLSAQREQSQSASENNLYPFGPGGPAVPVKIKGNSTVVIVLLIGLFVIGGTLFWVLLKNQELERRGTISALEDNLRRRIELFCEISTKEESSVQHLHQQADALLKEIASSAAPRMFEDAVNMALRNSDLQRELREASPYRSRYEQTQSALDEKSAELGALREEIRKVLTDKSADETVKKLTETAVTLARENDVLKTRAEFSVQRADSIQQLADIILNDAVRREVYQILRSSNPGAVYDLLSLSKERYSRLSDSDYQFYTSLASVAVRVNDVLRKGTGITGRTTAINGANLTLATVSGETLTFLDEQKRIVPYALTRLTPQELYMLFKPVFPDHDPKLLKYALCVIRGTLGDALNYTEGDFYREQFARKLLSDAFARLTEAVKNDPGRAVFYERSIRHMMGSGGPVKPYLNSLEELMTQARSVMPSLPDFLLNKDSKKVKPYKEK